MITTPIPYLREPIGERPLVDLREHLSWRERIPSRLTTGALWVGCMSLLGPMKLGGLVMVGTLLTPGLLWLDRSRHRAHPAPIPASLFVSALPDELPRSALAKRLGLSESQLFRARHASICTVHHDAEGHIVGLELAAPAPSIPLSSPDAHPVG